MRLESLALLKSPPPFTPRFIDPAIPLNSTKLTGKKPSSSASPGGPTRTSGASSRSTSPRQDTPRFGNSAATASGRCFTPRPTFCTSSTFTCMQWVGWCIGLGSDACVWTSGRLIESMGRVHGSSNRNNQPAGVMQPGHTFTIEPMICEGTNKHILWPVRACRAPQNRISKTIT